MARFVGAFVRFYWFYPSVGLGTQVRHDVEVSHSIAAVSVLNDRLLTHF